MLLIRSHWPSLIVAAVAALALAVPNASAAERNGAPVAQLVRNAACDHNQQNTERRGRGRTNVNCDNTYELKGFLDAVDGVIDPAIIAAIAVSPFFLIGGILSVMASGGRGRGFTMIASSLGGIIFLVSVNGIVA
jgi:hypothetical protein